MKILMTLAILTAFVALYVTLIRPWLRKQPWAQGFFANPAIEWMELKLWSKSESILWARWQQLLGLVLTITGFLGGIDYSIFAPVVPEKMVPLLPLIPVILNITGSIAESLRRDTTKPLEVVALPENKPAEVEAAIAKVERTNEQAVAKVEEAKAEGSV